MTQVRDEELSALLDGELDISRAEQVRAAIHGDPQMASRFEGLARLDACLRDAAEEAAFMPRVSLPAAESVQRANVRWLGAVAVVIGLLAVRLLPKLAELSWLGIVMQVAACAAIAFVVVTMASGGLSSDDKLPLSRA